MISENGEIEWLLLLAMLMGCFGMAGIAHEDFLGPLFLCGAAAVACFWVWVLCQGDNSRLMKYRIIMRSGDDCFVAERKEYGSEWKEITVWASDIAVAVDGIESNRKRDCVNDPRLCREVPGII